MPAEISEPKGGLLLGVLPAAIVVIAFAGGLYHSLTVPALTPPMAEPDEPEAPPPEPLPDRMYVNLINSITTTLPRLGGTVVIEFGLAVRDDTSPEVLKKFEEDPEPLLAPLTEVLMQMVDELPEGATWHDVRQGLPERLRDKLNETLTSEDVPDPVYEVLITKFSVAG